MTSLPDPASFTGAAPRDLVPLPRAAALLLWASAYLRGDIGPDDAALAAHGTGHRDMSGHPRVPPSEHRDVQFEGADLFDWMTGLRHLPLVLPQLVLPAPGRISGLIGPPAAISAALESEQAIVVSAAGFAEHTLVPATRAIGSEGMRGVVVDWRLIPARTAPVAPPVLGGGARETFLRALHKAAAGTVELDLVPEEQVELATLPLAWTATQLPRHLSPAVEQQLVLTARTLLLADQELSAGSDQARGLAEEQARTRVLTELRDGARAALAETISALIAADDLR